MEIAKPKFVVYSPAVARRLTQKGYATPRIEPSRTQENLNVFLFTDSEELRQDVLRIGQEIKRSREGREKKKLEGSHE